MFRAPDDARVRVQALDRAPLDLEQSLVASRPFANTRPSICRQSLCAVALLLLENSFLIVKVVSRPWLYVVRRDA